MNFDRIYRHGDVILFRARDPESTPEAGTKARVLTLAFGEATGHAHRLTGDLELLEGRDGEGRMLLRLHACAVLQHQEHATMVLEPGVYLKVDQVEYDPYRDAIRRIAD